MKPLRFSMSMREEKEREAENQAGDEGGKPLEESIEHGGADPTLEFARRSDWKLR
jgi:hypothetical protein